MARGGRRWGLLLLLLVGLVAPPRGLGAQSLVRIRDGRFTGVAQPPDTTVLRTLLRTASTRDSFPDLPRPRAAVDVWLAPDSATFRAWVGPGVPEWGAAIAIPGASRIVLQRERVLTRGPLATILRHELAHLALHEALGNLPPRWFDEGYASVAAGEWDREAFVAVNAALVARRIPGYAGLDSLFETRSGLGAQAAYALAHRAVAELAALDRRAGLANLLVAWRETGRLDPAIRRAYGLTEAAAEARFRSRTRWRIAFLAVGVDGTLLMLVLLGPMIPLYRRRRREQAARLARLRAHEAILERAQHAAAVEQLLAGPRPLDPASGDR